MRVWGMNGHGGLRRVSTNPDFGIDFHAILPPGPPNHKAVREPGSERGGSVGGKVNPGSGVMKGPD